MELPKLKVVISLANKQKLVKCRYTHCRHPNDLKPPSEMVRGGGTTYYHRDCGKERDIINRIVEYYRDNIDGRVTVAQLRNVINNIIFKKGVPAEELLFDITYVHNSGRKINSPYSLHYIIDNKKVQNEYKKYIQKQSAKVDVSKVATAKETTFKTKAKGNGFSDIF